MGEVRLSAVKCGDSEAAGDGSTGGDGRGGGGERLAPVLPQEAQSRRSEEAAHLLVQSQVPAERLRPVSFGVVRKRTPPLNRRAFGVHPKEQSGCIPRRCVFDGSGLRDPFQGTIPRSSAWPAYNSGPSATRLRVQRTLGFAGLLRHRRFPNGNRPPQSSRCARRLPVRANRCSGWIAECLQRQLTVRHARGEFLPIPKGRGLPRSGRREAFR